MVLGSAMKTLNKKQREQREKKNKPRVLQNAASSTFFPPIDVLPTWK
jgi:hypothetical protein